jgi:dTDP-4-dehydrorhamnose reductase
MVKIIWAPEARNTLYLSWSVGRRAITISGDAVFSGGRKEYTTSLCFMELK